MLIFLSLCSCGSLSLSVNRSIKWHGGQLELVQVAASTLSLTGSLKVQAIKIGNLPVLPVGKAPSNVAGGSSYNQAAAVAWFVRLQSL